VNDESLGAGSKPVIDAVRSPASREAFAHWKTTQAAKANWDEKFDQDPQLPGETDEEFRRHIKDKFKAERRKELALKEARGVQEN
jgi:hypothetical protein